MRTALHSSRSRPTTTFWTRLEAALDAEPPLECPSSRPPHPGGRPGPRTPVPVRRRRAGARPSLAVVPPAFRRTSNAVLVAVAAAAVVVVGIAGLTLMEERRHDVERPTEARRRPRDAHTRTPSPRRTVTTLTADREDASSEAVLPGRDLGTGDAEQPGRRWATTSQAHFGSQAEFEAADDRPGRGLRRLVGRGARRRARHPGRGRDEGTFAVVTLIGTVEQEGTAQDRADAFPVRSSTATWSSSPSCSRASRGRLPEPAPATATSREPVGLEEELVFVLPEDAEAPGGPDRRRRDGDLRRGRRLGLTPTSTRAPGQRCAYAPQDGFVAGDHTVTVAFLGPDGDSITAESLQFEAA